MEKNEVVKAVEEGLATIQAGVDTSAKRLKAQEEEFAKLKEAHEKQGLELKSTQQHLQEVEAKVNSERKRGIQDSVIASIPDEYRVIIDREERRGTKDPALKAAHSLWFHFNHMAKVTGLGLAPSKFTPAQYLEFSDKLERGMGYDPVLKAALGEDTAGLGGNIIATPVEASLMRLIVDNGILRPLVTKIVMTAKTHQLPTEGGGLTAYIVPEVGTITDSQTATTQFLQTALTAKKFAGIATVSNELLQDNIVGLSDYLFTAIAERIARLEDSEGFDGSSFTGLSTVAGINSITNTTVGGAPSYTDLVRLVFAATEQATRVNASFAAHPKAWLNVVGLVDSSGAPIFQFANVPNAAPNRLLGYPVELSSVINTNRTVGSTGGTSNIYYGPMSKIIFGDLTGMAFDTDPYGLFTTAQTRVRVIKRTGIAIPVGTFFSYLKGVKVG